jgi:hypothetical protein
MNHAAGVLTEATLRESLDFMARQKPQPAVLFMSPWVKKAWDEAKRTKTIRMVGNYALRELDGRRFWVRAVSINAGLTIRSFPRMDGEGWSTWYYYNRHFRKRGYPKENPIPIDGRRS